MLGKKRSNQSKINKSESFLSKLHDILSDTIYNEIIHWDADGKRIIIADVIELCNLILPKFYKHHNYSSFVRQLNMYGFHKSKGIIKSGEGYEHESFCKESTKDEITQMNRTNKKMKILLNYIKSNQKDDSNENDFPTNGNEDDVLKYLYEKNEENVQNSLLLKKEMEELRKENTLLNEEIAMFKSVLNSHKLILEKILKKSNDNCNQNTMQKGKKIVKSLNDLFSKYLYYLKIYSPFVDIENNTTVKQREERDEANANESTKENDMKNIIQNKDIEKVPIENDNEGFFDEFSLFNSRNDYPFLDLNLNNNYSSKSFLSINRL
jgi:hypothetical protein